MADGITSLSEEYPRFRRHARWAACGPRQGTAQAASGRVACAAARGHTPYTRRKAR
jgi:hypothetical protein